MSTPDIIGDPPIPLLATQFITANSTCITAPSTPYALDANDSATHLTMAKNKDTPKEAPDLNKMIQDGKRAYSFAVRDAVGF
jgi:hypothetical protein